MRIFINDREVATMTPGGATVGDIVEAARVHVDPGDIMTSVRVDGVSYGAGGDDRHLRRSAADVATLVVETETPVVFVAGKRRGLIEAAAVLAAKVRRVVELLRASDEQGANRLLAALMEELRLALLLDQQLATLDGGTPAGAQEEIRRLAPALLEAQERRAWQSLAGLLDERLAPILETWSAGNGAGAPAAS
jgi:hypothetical protein